MVKVREDLTGRIFGKLKVLEQAEDYIQPDGVHRPMWKCQCCCDENNIVIVQGNDLKQKKTRSCGCLYTDIVRKYNDYELNLEDTHGLYGIGYCKNTNSKFYFDMDDYDIIKNYCWIENIKDKYHSLRAWDIGVGGNIVMAHLLVGKYYDHKDRNPLNNRRYNLRKATCSQNTSNRGVMKRNKSGVTGVYFDKKTCRWRVNLQVNYKKIKFSSYNNKEDAIKARLQAEKKYFGEFAPQKYLFKKYGIILEANND